MTKSQIDNIEYLRYKKNMWRLLVQPQLYITGEKNQC